MSIKKWFWGAKWPILCGLLLALTIQQLFPQLTASHKGLLSSIFDQINWRPNRVSYFNAVKIASPAVVHIFSNADKVLQNKLEDNHYSSYFRNHNSLGSGVIVSKKGYILTNYHVIKEHKFLFVSLKDGRQAQATLIGSDMETDLAVLKIKLPDLPTIIWINSQKNVHVGDVVLAIGNPFGLGQAVSAGIISAKQRKLKLNVYENFIQTDAAINLGNSGGALINTNGELVGIATALITSHGGNEGLGFAIPSNMARFVMQSIIANGKVIRGWLGIEAQKLTSGIAKLNGILKQDGILVYGVYPNSPAERAGVAKGDIILNINNRKTNYGPSIMAYVATLTPGKKIVMTLLRDKEKIHIKLKVTQKPLIT